MRGGKSRKSSKFRARALRPGRLVFLAEHLRTSAGVAHATHPRVVVSAGLLRLAGAHQPQNCVVVRPLPEASGLPESTHAASEVVGLVADFERVWREHVTPGSQLEEAMLEAVEMHRLRSEPLPTAAQVWKQLARGTTAPAEISERSFIECSL